MALKPISGEFPLISKCINILDLMLPVVDLGRQAELLLVATKCHQLREGLLL